MFKRLFANAFCAIIVASCSASAFAKDWLFDVYLDKQKIGSHRFSLNQQQLESRADFKVKVLFINAYRYQHRADEQWQGQCLSQLTAHTEENKEITDVKGEQQDGQFVVEKKGSAQTLPACVMTFAYWNPLILKQTRLLNPQNAEYLDVTVTDEGSKNLEVKGQMIPTQQYRLLGRYKGKVKLNITLWYDQQQAWVALESRTPEGYIITYKLI